MKPEIYSADLLFQAESPPPLPDFGRRILAEGDSFFTIGTLNPFAASNMLRELRVSQSTAIVSCAYPGDTLQRMVDRINDPYFDRLLRWPNFASYWEGILISAGGNDLIDMAQVPPVRNGIAVPPAQRLLRTAQEANSSPNADPKRFISEAGWASLAYSLRSNFAELVARRDQGPSKGRPIFLHTYARPTVRPAGTVGARQGWLYPALLAYGLNGPQAQAVSNVMFDRLRNLLRALDANSGQPESLPQVHVFDSAGLAEIVPAEPETTDSSNDWVNEIHLTPDGYGKLGRAFGPWMEQKLTLYP